MAGEYTRIEPELSSTEAALINPTVLVLGEGEGGVNPVQLFDVLKADYSDRTLYPEGWTGHDELAVVRYAKHIHDGDIKVPAGRENDSIRDLFDDYLGDNPDFNMEPVKGEPAEAPEDTGPQDTGDTGLYTSPSEAMQELTDEAKEYLREPEAVSPKDRLLEAAKRAIEQEEAAPPQERIDYLSPRSDPDAKGWGGIMKQVRAGAEKKKIKDNKSMAMTAAINALHPEKVSEIPRALRMQESKRDVREDEEKQ